MVTWEDCVTGKITWRANEVGPLAQNWKYNISFHFAWQDGTDTIICSRLNDGSVAIEHYTLNGYNSPVQTKPVRIVFLKRFTNYVWVLLSRTFLKQFTYQI